MKAVNRRCQKNINQYYRAHGDIWALLGQKQRDNFITNLLYRHALISFKINLRRSKISRTAKKKIWESFRSRKKYTGPLLFEINTQSPQKRKRTCSRRGLLLKLRKQISLFYSGGRIRKQTYRRYGRITTNRTSSYHNHDQLPIQHRTFTSILESRIDVLLFRSLFVDSVYKARIYIRNRKCKIRGLTTVTHPALLLKNFQLFGLTDKYTKKLRLALLRRIKKHTIVNLPSYLYINFALLIAFKIEDPIFGVSYPFGGSAGHFRKLFQML